MKIGDYNLRNVSDEEYDEANSLIDKGLSLNFCPTCKHNYRELPRQFTPVYKLDDEYHPCDCQIQIALYTRYLLARIPDQYMTLNWEDYDGSPEAIEFVDSYLSNWESYLDHGFGVEFGGPKMGIGKSFAATHIGKELIKRRQKVLFIPFEDMVAAFHRQDADQMEDRIRRSTYVILDEIKPPVSERQRDFFHSRFEAVIRHRTNYDLPTIITTNLTAKELDKAYPRTYSLLAAKQKRIDMDGDDFRASSSLETLERIENHETKPIS